MASRRDNPLARWRLDWELPHHVIIWWGNYQSGENAYLLHQRDKVSISALALDGRSKHYSAWIEWDEYLVFCFGSREAAQQFRDRWNGQFIDTDEVSRKGTWTPREGDVCNLYSMLSNQEGIRGITRAMIDSTGNMEPTPEIWPDRMAPIVRNTSAGRELVQVRWGLPSSSQALFKAATKRADSLRKKGKQFDFQELLKMEPDGGTTNVRNVASKHWKRWHGTEFRCVVPFTSFAEPDPASKPDGGRTPNAWFAADPSCPLMFFAGIWVPQWQSVRRIKEGLITVDLFGFLTTDANDLMRPIHEKAMPSILTNQDEIETWLTAPWEEASKLQRPLRNDQLVILPTAEVSADANAEPMLPL
ncbi:SOS response-associated peptidase [Rhizobium leguminosarum]|uniref:SOS response-associated peptidase family protein n=1 Tax=Rhizobium leguminosarum TaxID=384 RepID=UPI001C90D008|nr:SOS response-associated peptidase family protein [Rhizobium leguminosarum]MBY2996732.1 SOS response-associated peptidase [Rhizobium leguminosarum]MBY3061444.1 SOS response-associated peptidase [Rhizobium leguminosarum]